MTERLTFKEVRSELTNQFQYDEASPRMKDLVNAASRRLKRNKQYASCYQKIHVAVYNSTISLPRGYHVALKAAEQTVARQISGAFFEFHMNAYFPETDAAKQESNSNDLLDAGSDWPTFRDISEAHTTNATIRAETTLGEDAAARILIRGTLDGDKVYSTDAGNTIEGVYLSLAAATQDTTQEFDRITQIVKPVTKRPVKLYSVVSAVATQIAEYEPGEKNPGYRRYRVGSHMDDGDVVTVLAKKAHINAVADDDIVEPNNVDALKAMAQGIWWENRNEPEQSALFMRRAHRFLDEDMREYLGTTQNMRVEQDVATSLGGFVAVN